MRVLVVGAGGVGSAFISIASRRAAYTHITIADIDLERAEQAVAEAIDTGALPDPTGERLAAATGGKYYRLGERGEGLEQLRREFLAPLAETAAREDLQNYSEWYHVPLALATASLVASLLLGAGRRQTPRGPEPVLRPPTP